MTIAFAMMLKVPLELPYIGVKWLNLIGAATTQEAETDRLKENGSQSENKQKSWTGGGGLAGKFPAWNWKWSTTFHRYQGC